jgi:hypothetical protein
MFDWPCLSSSQSTLFIPAIKYMYVLYINFLPKCLMVLNQIFTRSYTKVEIL